PHYGINAQCQYLDALLQTDQHTVAYPQIEQLWLSADSRPETCDAIFKQWQAAGYKTPLIIWQRFKLTMALGNLHLARYLIKFMPTNEAAIAKKWIKIYKNPQLITTSEALNIDHPDQANILLHGLKRLSRKDISLAINTYQQLDKNIFNYSQNAQLFRYFGLRLAREHMPDASIWLSRIPASHVDKQVEEWTIRTAIRQGDWRRLLSSINNLSRHKQTEYRWQYWWAYANAQLGNKNEALGIYQYLATKRSYYGFLAADHLNLPYAFEEKAVEITPSAFKHVFERSEILRAREFYFMGHIISARREWRQLIQHINNEEKLAASKIAQYWKWHDRAIITMGKTRYRDDIELRFPLHLDKKVHAWSNQRKIDPEWIYAIIRRESAFMTDARSPVGAMGLMQLMPKTARHVARQLNIRYKGRNSLLGSNTNIRLGTSYLERMLSKLNSQQVLATAAYNAGPHRVKKWLPIHNKMTAAQWIETIPFSETREYVSHVLAYTAIYQHRMEKQITRLSLRMPLVPIKQPTSISKPVSNPPHTAQTQLTTPNGPS
ncbi:Soluble lytic murein transglycosylase precursor, partial [hydrothermal vent metagenome]